MKAKNMAKSKLKPRIAGRWLIESVSMQGKNISHDKVRGYFEFGKKAVGSFQIDCVQGQIDYRIGERHGKSVVDFSWDGHDEMDPMQGRGWLVLEGDKFRECLHPLWEDLDVVLKRVSEPQQRT